VTFVWQQSENELKREGFIKYNGMSCNYHAILSWARQINETALQRDYSENNLTTDITCQ